jgi:exonuclease VII small subunit
MDYLEKYNRAVKDIQNLLAENKRIFSENLSLSAQNSCLKEDLSKTVSKLKSSEEKVEKLLEKNSDLKKEVQERNKIIGNIKHFTHEEELSFKETERYKKYETQIKNLSANVKDLERQNAELFFKLSQTSIKTKKSKKS